MENYININNLINNEINNILKDLVICTLCSNILIDPYMCMKCQKVYCKKCIDEWKDKEKDDKCPNKCENPNYQKSLEKNNILCKLKFKCEKCENEFLYEELIKHIANCSGQAEKGENINNGINENISTRRLRKISKNEAEKLKIKSTKITSKLNIFYNYFIINIVIVLGYQNVGKSSLIYT